MSYDAPDFSVPLLPAPAAGSFLAQPAVIPQFDDLLIAMAKSAFYVVRNDGFLIASVTAGVRLSGFTTIDSDLYVLDGPVLLKYDVSSLSPQTQVNGPDLAVNVMRRDSKRYDPKYETWAQGKQRIYPEPGEAVPMYAPALVASGQDGNPWIFALGDDGSVRGVDQSFTLWAVGQKGMPDALTWRVETDAVSAKQYLCYPSDNTVVCLDASSPTLQVGTFSPPQPLGNATAWVRVRHNDDAGSQPFVWFTNVKLLVTQLDTMMCEADYSQGGTTLTLWDFGTGGPPQFGQAQITVNAPPPALPGATQSVPDALAGRIMLAPDGDRIAAIFCAVDSTGSYSLQKWRFPDLADDATTRSRWSDAQNGVQPLPGYIEALCSLVPVAWISWDPWTTCGIAALCLQKGTSGTFAV